MVALARPNMAESSVTDFGANVLVTLGLSQPVLWRLYTLDQPRRLVIEFGEVDWSGTDPAGVLDSDMVTAIHTERVPGWSRLVLTLAAPLRLETAGMTTGAADGSAVLKLQLAPTDDKSFTAGVRMLPAPTEGTAPGAPERPAAAEGPLTVLLDPGHGGIDPGALAGTATEAHLMLTFARELAAELTARGMTAVLTRDTDIFVPLETRVSLAREAGADVFLSLHADALAEGHASGATVYTLSPEAQATASQMLAERHERDDLVQGIDLHGQDDEVAKVLMSLARAETQPRAEALADAIVEGLGDATGNLHKRPRLTAGFSVLKAADIPSVLVELGFLSDEDDRRRIGDPDWRLKAARGIADAVTGWAASDAELRERLRR